MSNEIPHPELLEIAIRVGTRMSEIYLKEGDYRPNESWGAEGQIYPSLTGIALLLLYKKTGNALFLKGAKSIVDSNFKKQFDSGGWPLNLGVNSIGTCFTTSDKIKFLSTKHEDLPSTLTALRLASEYQVISGDNQFEIQIRKGFDFILLHWDKEQGYFQDMMPKELLSLRARPKDYHIFAFQAIVSLSKIYKDANEYIKPLYNSVVENFLDMPIETYPLLMGMHVHVLLSEETRGSYVSEVIKTRINGNYGLNSPFLLSNHPGALGHMDGLRGLTLTEGHLRNSVGLAMALSKYDLVNNERSYIDSTLYCQLKKWILSMYSSNLFYEYLDLNLNQKKGTGSSAQYLPIFWILGEF